jgi:23S rRNA (uracil1939-C5)-methyltransferase
VVEVCIHGLAVNGDGVGKLEDGRVVFVARALPGDVVRVRLTETRKKVQFAELVDVLVPSSGRVKSGCGIEACGGCALRSASKTLQGNIKHTQVVETLRRVGHIDVETLLPPLFEVGDGWRYRHRVRLHTLHTEEGWVLGYHGKRSRMPVPFSACPVLWPELQHVCEKLARVLQPMPASLRFEDIEIAYSRRDQRAAAHITLQGSAEHMRHNMDWIHLAGLSGVDIASPSQRIKYGNVLLRYDHAKADTYDMFYEPSVFTQANPLANEALVSYVLGVLRPREQPHIVELHAGIGNFSVPLARAGAHVQAFERSGRAVALCAKNARAPGLNLEVQALDDTQAVEHVQTHHAVLLDPPRTGAYSVASALVRKSPHTVVYVSCDVATLARDAAVLRAGGYHLESVKAFDMFAQTPHVEVVMVLRR